MIKKIFIILFIFFSCYADEMKTLRWEKGETFLDFLSKNSIPLSLYYDLQGEDQELATEIMSNQRFQILYDDDKKIRQVLIPIGDELQIHLYKNNSGEFVFSTTPLIYIKENKKISFKMEKSPYQDIIEKTNNMPLANELSNAFKGNIDFKSLKKGDQILMYYEQRTRLGRILSNIDVEAILIKTKNYEHKVFKFDERFYNEHGKEMENFFLIRPIDNYKRISSKFTYKRWHPILKRYRAHLGVDYAANTGTPVKAAGDGLVSYTGRKGGYGKTVIIKHSDGYKTLYAHLNGYSKKAKTGKKIYKGQIIGYVGSTGMSTGPHLHFGLYKNNRAINPSKVVKITKSVLSGKNKKEFIEILKKYDVKFKEDLEQETLPLKIEEFTDGIALK